MSVTRKLTCTVISSTGLEFVPDDRDRRSAMSDSHESKDRVAEVLSIKYKSINRVQNPSSPSRIVRVLLPLQKSDVVYSLC